MSKATFSQLITAFFAAFFLVSCDDKSAMSAQNPSPATVTSTSKNSLAQTAYPDMTLPLPRGLKGNPDKAAVFFLQNCATCHGTSGDGEGPRAYFINPPPRNFLLASSRQRLNRPTLFEAISNGRLGSEMPAWNKVLNEQEIADLAEFVFQTFILPSPDNEKLVNGKSK